jgi:predicted nucleic acid-binding protein
VRRLTTAFPVLALQDDDVRTVGQLSEEPGVKGADVFDLAIAATALRAGISIICTFDARIFSRIAGLQVREP